MADTFPGGRDALSLKHFGAQTHTSDKAFVGLEGEFSDPCGRLTLLYHDVEKKKLMTTPMSLLFGLRKWLM